MTTRQIVLAIVLADFVGLTLYAIATEGLAGFVSEAVVPLLGSAWGVQLLFDFVIALSLVLLWMLADARVRGIRSWPFALLTLCLGSIGPLAYLARRELPHRAPRGQVAPGRQPA